MYTNRMVRKGRVDGMCRVITEGRGDKGKALSICFVAYDNKKAK